MNTAKLEKYLQKAIFPDLERGRPGWDKPHTEAVVHHMKKLLLNFDGEKLDEYVLLIAAYAHDWGYSDLFGKGRSLSYSDVSEKKKAHMRLGAKKNR